VDSVFFPFSCEGGGAQAGHPRQPFPFPERTQSDKTVPSLFFFPPSSPHFWWNPRTLSYLHCLLLLGPFRIILRVCPRSLHPRVPPGRTPAKGNVIHSFPSCCGTHVSFWHRGTSSRFFEPNLWFPSGPFSVTLCLKPLFFFCKKNTQFFILGVFR